MQSQVRCSSPDSIRPKQKFARVECENIPGFQYESWTPGLVNQRVKETWAKTGWPKIPSLSALTIVISEFSSVSTRAAYCFCVITKKHFHGRQAHPCALPREHYNRKARSGEKNTCRLSPLLLIGLPRDVFLHLKVSSDQSGRFHSPALFLTVRYEIAEPLRKSGARSPEDPNRTRTVR